MANFESSLESIPLKEWQVFADKVLPIMYHPFIDTIDNSKVFALLTSNIENIYSENILYAFICKNISDEVFEDLRVKVIKRNVTRETLISFLYNKRIDEVTFGKIKDYFKKPKIHLETVSNDYSSIKGSEDRFYELLDYQVSVKERIMSHLQEESTIKKVLVHMPTGTGKTKTTMHTIVKYQNDILDDDNFMLWIAHTNTLLEQAEDTYKKVWEKLGYGYSDICNYYGSNSIPLYFKKGIIFASVNKLINAFKNHTEDYKKIISHCELIVFDEAHKCVADETQYMLNDMLRVTKNVKSRTLIGLTATPGRSMYDVEDNDRLSLMFDRRIITINPNIIENFSHQSKMSMEEHDLEIIHYFKQRGILASLKREELVYEHIQSPAINKKIKDALNSKSEDLSKEVVRFFEEHYQRNKVIINRLVQLDESNIPTIVFACSIEHGKFLKNMLTIRGVKSREVYGSTDNSERKSTIKAFKNNKFNILINCSVLTTGFDSTNIKCVFITRPTKSVVLYSQMIGRGLRGKLMGGNSECLLIDIKDNLIRFDNESSSFNVFNNYWR